MWRTLLQPYQRCFTRFDMEKQLISSGFNERGCCWVFLSVCETPVHRCLCIPYHVLRSHLEMQGVNNWSPPWVGRVGGGGAKGSSSIFDQSELPKSFQQGISAPPTSWLFSTGVLFFASALLKTGWEPEPGLVSEQGRSDLWFSKLIVQSLKPFLGVAGQGLAVKDNCCTSADI